MIEIEQCMYKTVELEKFFFSTNQIVDIRIEPKHAIRMLEYQLRVYVLGEKIKSYNKRIDYPADWWEAFKERWMPRWFKRKYPVQYKLFKVDIDIVALYPELSKLKSLPKDYSVFRMNVIENEECLYKPY